MANFSVLQQPNKGIKIQKIDNAVNYRLCKYTIITKTKYNDIYYTCVYNTLNDACIIYDTYTDKIRDYSIKNWFLVPEDFNEYEFAKELKEARNVKTQTKQNISNFVILTTTDCNANCYYCFEAGVKKHSMTPKVAEDVAEFIMKESSGKNVSLKWFGGEPLFNQSAIDNITAILRNNEIKYKSSMITNGYLFNELFLENYKKLWKLKKVQITLDGINEYYNAIKDYIYKDDTNPFETVISNIELLIKNKINVSIRLNVTLDNFEELKNTIDYLYKRIGKNKYFSVYAHGVFQLENERPEEIYPLIEEIHNYIFNKFGYNAKLKPLIKSRFCLADNPTSCIIMPTGKIGICEHYIDDNIMGDIYNGIHNTDVIKKFNKPAQYEYCKCCKFYPSCNMLKHCGDEIECNKYKIHEKIFVFNQLLFKQLKQYIKYVSIYGN